MTGFFGRLERLLAGLVEGTVERLFKPRLQPIHLTRRMDAAMEEEILVGAHGPLAPNHYVVTLDPAAYARFTGAAAAIQSELEQHAVRAAARRGLRHLDPVQVELQAGPALAEGQFTVNAAFLGRSAVANGTFTPSEAAGRAEQTQVMPAAPGGQSETALAALELLGLDGTVRSLPLLGGACTIGRAEDNALTLAETTVSRHHAVIRQRQDHFVVEDLQSANGVLVNGKQVQSARLKDGDRVLIGSTELVFRQR